MGESDNKKLTTKLCKVWNPFHSLQAETRETREMSWTHNPLTLFPNVTMFTMKYQMMTVMSDKGFATSSQCFNQLWLIFTRIVFGIPQSFWNQSSGMKLCILSRIMTGTPVSVSISVSLPLSRNNTCLAHCVTLMQLQYTNSICWCWCSMHLMFATR